MTSVDRAKRFLQNKSRSLAMAAIPLAALVTVAMPAKASFSFSNPLGCSGGTINSNQTGGCSGSLLPTQPNGVNGVSFNGSYTVTAVSPGGYTFNLDWSSAVSGGTFTGQIPVTWDFTVTPSDTVTSWDWSLDFVFGGAFSVPESGTASGVQHIQGSDFANFTGQTVGSFLLEFSLSQNATNGNESFTLTIPADTSFDVNAAAPTPEPSTFVLVALPMGYLLWRRFRRKSFPADRL
jgi:hypothetical protein